MILKINPKTRLICAIFYFITIALLHKISVLLASCMFSIILVMGAKLNFNEVVKKISFIFFFLIFIWIILPITFKEGPMYNIGPITFSHGGIITAAQITIKIITLLFLFTALIATMSFVTLGHVLNKLYLPKKLVTLFLISYRYVAVIEGEYNRLWTAIKIRGFKSKVNLHSYKTLAYLVGILFVRASLKAERIYQAMSCRSFNGQFYSLNTFEFVLKDWLFAGLTAIIIFALWFLN